MSEQPRRSKARAIAYGALTLILIPVLLSATGVLDLRIPLPWLHRESAAGSSGRVLTPESPVKVSWTGTADAVEITWHEIDDPELHSYSVDVYALAPVESWYNVGYRVGEELRTSATTNPIAELNEYLHESGKSERVDNDQVWRICVTGMRETPGGVDITPYIIDGNK